MANNEDSLDKIWDDTKLDDQVQVNTAIKNSMRIIAPAVSKVWQVNLKVNALYAVLGFSVIAAGIIIGILQLVK